MKNPMQIDFRRQRTETRRQTIIDDFALHATPTWFDWISWILVLSLLRFLFQASGSILIGLILAASTGLLWLYFIAFFSRIDFVGRPFVTSAVRARFLSIVLSTALTIGAWQIALAITEFALQHVSLPLSELAQPLLTFPEETILSHVQGIRASIIVYDLDSLASGEWLMQHNPDAEYRAASLIKLPLVMTGMHLVHNGQLDLDTAFVLEEQDKAPGTGSLQYLPAGTRITMRELMTRALMESDNTAANMLFEEIGFDAVNEYMRQLDARDTHAVAPMLATAPDDSNVTTPEDMLLLLKTLANNEAAGAEFILSAMNQNIWQKMPAFLPDTLIIANKTGELDRLQHDVGIVYLPDGRRYILIIMIDDVEEGAGIHAIQQISLDVYQWFTE